MRADFQDRVDTAEGMIDAEQVQHYEQVRLWLV
jgi:hypothetical protein